MMAEYGSTEVSKGIFYKGNKKPLLLKLITNIKSTTVLIYMTHIPNECANTF